jgi:hypothetical protein
LGGLNLRKENNIKMDVEVAGSEFGNENQVAHYTDDLSLIR